MFTVRSSSSNVMIMNWQKKLNKSLGLNIEGQDWGIENSDPKRVKEFVAFFEKNKVSDPCEPEALAELIFQSAQEAFENHLLCIKDQRLLLAFYTKHRSKFPLAEEYWLSLNKSEWIITRLLTDQKEIA